MKYLTAKQVSEKWGLTVRRVQDLCKNGAVSGAERHGREWLIPEFAVKPADGRKTGVKRTVGVSEPQGDDRYFLSLLNLYNHPGTAASVLQSLADKPAAKDMFAVQMAIAQGEIDRAKELLFKYKDDNAGPARRNSLGMNIALCAIYDGDLKLWNEAIQYMQAAEFLNERQRMITDFWIAAISSLVYDTTFFPDWFRRGDFSPLPREAHPAARYFYAKYLYITAHEVSEWHGDKHPALTFLKVMPLIMEPLITQTHVEGVMMTEIYLRLMCATAYHLNRRDDLAVCHIEQVLDLALPDRLITPLAEYRHRMGPLLDERLEARDNRMFAEVKRQSKQLQKGWIKLHNQVRHRNVADNLSAREQQIAKLAVYGLSNKEIAERLNITVNAVKQILRSAMDKTGINSRSELKEHL